MRTLFVGNACSAFVHMLAVKMHELAGTDVYIADKLTGEAVHVKDADSAFLSRSRAIFMQPALKKIWPLFRALAKLPVQITQTRAEIVHIHFLMPYYFFLVPLLLVTRKRLVLSIYGSDLQAAARKPIIKWSYIPLLYLSEQIVFTNHNYRELFSSLFGKKYERKISIIPMGLKCIEVIDALGPISKTELESEFGVTPGKTVVVCGTYGGANNNQYKILSEIEACDSTTKTRLHLVFPCTYGASEDERAQLRQKLNTSGIPFTILESYLSYTDLARLRMITQVLIHTPNADQFSGAMLESLYSGAYLITGSWLNYTEMDEWGVHYKKVNSLQEIPMQLNGYFTTGGLSVAEANQNKAAIKQHISWPSSIQSWIQLYK